MKIYNNNSAALSKNRENSAPLPGPFRPFFPSQSEGKKGGEVGEQEGDPFCVKKNSLKKEEYLLETFRRSNQDTCLTHKPAVFENTWVQSGELLTDCASSVGGELSLGQNLLIAYMPWDGYNFEDAILISERLVMDDLYTSVHIERYELETQKTKLGSEEITRNIPDVSEEELSNLDSFGIVKLGSWVEEGDILVGKITPINKKKVSPYQKLLYSILEKQVRPFKDSSLRAPRGIKAKVIDIKYFLKSSYKSVKRQKEMNFGLTPENQTERIPMRKSKEITIQPSRNAGKEASIREAKKNRREKLSTCPSRRERRPRFGQGGEGENIFLKKINSVFVPVSRYAQKQETRQLEFFQALQKNGMKQPSFLKKNSFNINFTFLRYCWLKYKNLNQTSLAFNRLSKAAKKCSNLSYFPAFCNFSLKKSEKNGLEVKNNSFGIFVENKKGKRFISNQNTGAISPVPFPSLSLPFGLSPLPVPLSQIRRIWEVVRFPKENESRSPKEEGKDYARGKKVQKKDLGLRVTRTEHREAVSKQKNIHKKVPSFSVFPKAERRRKEKNQEILKNIETIHIYLAEKRKIQVGDKMAGRHGNKGIVSQILPIQDMPYLPDGTPIDMVLNPLGVPSRMNVGQIYECLLGLAGRFLGENYKVFSFDEIYGPEASRSFVFNKLYEARCKTGLKWLFDPNSPGKIRLFDGRNGECFDQRVTVGQAYILRLVHMVDDKIHCLTPEHDVLTSEGWLPIEKISRHHEVATLNRTGELIYQKPNNVFHYHNYKGFLYHIKNKNLDLVVTLNHRMYVKKDSPRCSPYPLGKANYSFPSLSRRELHFSAPFPPFPSGERRGGEQGRGRAIRTGQGLASLSLRDYAKPKGGEDDLSFKNYQLIQAKDLIGQQYKYLKNANWIKNDYQFTLPSIISNSVFIPEKKVNMDAWLVFFGLWMTEGLAVNNLENTTDLNFQDQAETENFYPGLDKVLFILKNTVTKLGYNYKIINNKITIFNKQLWFYLKSLNLDNSLSPTLFDQDKALQSYDSFPALSSRTQRNREGQVGRQKENKKLPSWVWQLSKKQAQLLLQSMCLDEVTSNEVNWSYYTCSIKLADDVMRLALHAGWSGNKYLHISKGSSFTPFVKDRAEKRGIFPTVTSKEKNDIINDDSIKANLDLWRIFIQKTDNNPVVNQINHKELFVPPSVASKTFIFPEPKEGSTDVFPLPSDYAIRFPVPSPFGLREENEQLPKFEEFGKGERGEEEILPYEGSVYCLSVPNEVFYVRRNGIPVWTGNSRSTGPYSLVTQQPLRGRSKQGGQRLGEMEVWALEGYGAAFTLLEMLTIKSDDMTGRMTLWSNLILNKDISIGTPESFKVLVCELQALCLDIGLFRNIESTGSSPESSFVTSSERGQQQENLREINNLMNLP